MRATPRLYGRRVVEIDVEGAIGGADQRIKMAVKQGLLKARVDAGTQRPVSDREIGIRWDATPIRSSSPPVRIMGSVRPYQGGYRVNV